MKLPIYLDNAATTPLDPRVLEAMLPYLSNEHHFGNPASMSHAFGQAARQAVDMARAEVADLIQAEASEIVWTSGATEAINLALKGLAQMYQRKGRHIVTLKTEHKAVLDTCQQLEKDGYTVTYLSPEANGLLDIEKFKAALRPDTIAVSIMHVNNETGVIQDIEAIAKITAEREILLHVDAAQSNGKLALDVSRTPIDLLSLSSHKIYGPKGIGALYLRRKPRVRVAPQIHGGGQEQGMRSGTLAPHQIVGMAEAFKLAKAEMTSNYKKMQALREHFLQLMAGVEMSVNGDLNNSYPGILNVCFHGRNSQSLMLDLPQLAVAAGSACSSKGIEPSYVLRAMGLSNEDAHSALRISFGRFTTLEEIEFAASALQAVLKNSNA